MQPKALPSRSLDLSPRQARDVSSSLSPMPFVIESGLLLSSSAAKIVANSLANHAHAVLSQKKIESKAARIN